MPPSASSNLPRRRASAPVNAPFSWPNSSDSISSSGIAAQLTSTNGRSRRMERQVDRARHQLLAAAVLAVDQHAAVGRRGGGDLLAQRPDRRALADDLGALIETRAQGRVLALEPRVLEGAADRDQDLLEGERLLDEVVGAQARGLDRRLDRAVAGDHHDDGLRTRPLELGERLEAVHAVHPDVEEGQIGQLVGEELAARRHRRRPPRPDSPSSSSTSRRVDRMAGSSSTIRMCSPATSPSQRVGHSRRPRPGRRCATPAPR